MDGAPAARAGAQRRNDLITHLDNEPVKGRPSNRRSRKCAEPRIHRFNCASAERRRKAGRGSSAKSSRSMNVRARIEGNDVGHPASPASRASARLNKAGVADVNRDVPADKLKGYIVDLRNNGGGLLDQAIAVSDAFLERGESFDLRPQRKIHSGTTAGRHHQRQAGDRSDQRWVGFGLRNRCRALQDHKRATWQPLIGKGSVQGRRSDRIVRRTQAHDRALLHPRGPFDLGQGYLARYRARPGSAGMNPKGKIETRGELSLRGHLKNGEKEEEQAGAAMFRRIRRTTSSSRSISCAASS